MKRFYIFIIALLIAGPIHAQTDGLSYQAVILNPSEAELPGIDASGSVYPNKEISIRFTITNASEAVEYQETHNTTTDDYGIINLFIGDGNQTSTGGFSEISWNGTNKNLLVEIDFEGKNNFTTLSEQKLTYLPFAAHRNISASGTLTVDGVVTFNNDFVIEGKTIFNNDLAINGNTSVAGNTDIVGSTTIGTDLTVDGVTNLNNTLSVNNATSALLTGTLDVGGVTRLSDQLTVAGHTQLNNTASITGAANLADSLTVSGLTNLNNQLTVAGHTQINNTASITGAANLADRLTVSGLTNLNNQLTVAGHTQINNTASITGAANLADNLTVNGLSNLNNQLTVAGHTQLNNTASITGAANLGYSLSVDGIANLNSSLNVNNASSTNLSGALSVTGNTNLSNLIVRGPGNTNGEHIALFENTGGGNADGIAIRIDKSTLGFRNRFITFYGQGNYMAGRIESFDLFGGDTYESFPIPNFANLFNVFDFNNVLTGGALPSLSFSGGSLPSASFYGGSLPSINFAKVTFSAGSLPSLSFSPGSLPTANFNVGSFPTLDFTGFFDPQAGATAAGEIGALVGWGMRNGYPGYVPSSPWQIAMVPVVLAAKQLAMNQGVIYGSKGADYAEWLEKENLEEKFVFGEVVGIKGGKISKKTEGADHVLTISLAPIVLGNMPDESKKENYEKVGFMGQLPVLVVGVVSVGDFIVASGYNDGYAKAISPSKIKLNDLKGIIGKAWSSSNGNMVNLINVSVGLKTNEWVDIFNQQEERLNELESKIEKINAFSGRLEELEAKVKSIGLN